MKFTLLDGSSPIHAFSRNDHKAFDRRCAEKTDAKQVNLANASKEAHGPVGGGAAVMAAITLIRSR